MFRVLVSRAVRRVRGEDIPEELRGWRWEDPPVKPRAYLGFGVSEIVPRYCESFRDVWLRRVAGVIGDGSKGGVAVGRVVHEVFHAAAEDLRGLLTENVEVWQAAYRLLEAGVRDTWPDWAANLYRRLVLAWAGEVEGILLSGGSIWSVPWVTEVVVDGSLVGLSQRLRVDAIAGGGVVVEVKVGRARSDHNLVLAGYALALESQLEVPFDYGVVINVLGVPDGEPRFEAKGYFIGETARRRFLEYRDEAIDVVLGGRQPPVNGSCSKSCPFYSICHGG